MPHLDEGTLQAWLDRPRSGLDPGEALEIERHLEACDACMAALDTLAGFDHRAAEILGGAERGEVEVPDFETVLARRGPEGGSGPTLKERESRLQSMAWAASLVLALGIGWVAGNVYRGGSGPGSTPGSPGDVAFAPELAPAAESDEVAQPEVRQSVAPTAEVPERPEAEAFGGAQPAEPSAQAARAQGAPEPEPGPVVNPPQAIADAVVAAPSADRAGGPGVDGPPDPAPAPAAPSPAPPPAGDSADSVPDPQLAVVAPLMDDDLTASITGRVTDAGSGEPVVSAQVYVDGFDLGALTGQDGTFDLSGVPADSSVDVVVQRLGFREGVREVALGPGQTTVVDFSIEQAALQLDEVIATGTAGGTQRRAIGNAIERAAVSDGVESLRVLLVPDLEVIEIEILSTSQAVRVRQALDASNRLVMVQSVGAPSDDLGGVPEGQPIETIEAGGLFVTATAPVSVDSLRVLLESLRE